MAAKRVVLITGANTGLGLEIVRALCKESTAYEIIVGSRSSAKGEEACKTVKGELPQTSSTLSVVPIDVTSDDSIQNAVKQVESKHGKLDVLINNAGASFDTTMQEGKLTMREGWNAGWDVNVAGAHINTHLFMPLLLKSSDPRLLFIASGTSSLSETERSEGPLGRINQSPPAGWPKEPIMNPTFAYRSSKAGLNMMMRQWHRVLKNDSVKVFAVSPGFLATALNGFTPEQLRKVGHAIQ